MHKHFKRHSLAIFSCFLPFATTAQPTTTTAQLDSIVVTASRTPQPLKDVVGDVSVISSEDLQKSGQSSLADALGKQAGVQFYTSGGAQTITGVHLRGTNTKHTLVLIDGMRINGAISSSVQWGAIDPATIERVEILRGAASSLYGSDAIGGVINIITKKSGEDRPFAAWGNIGIGSYDTFKSSIGFSGANSGWDYALSSSMVDSGGFNASNPSSGKFTYDPDIDGYSQHTLSGSLGYRWSPGQHIGLTAYNGYIKGDYDVGPFDPRAYGITRQQAYTLTSTNEITDFWESVLRVGFSKDSYDDRTSWGVVHGTIQRSYSWQNNLTLTENHKLSTLFERTEERLQSTDTYTHTRRNTNAIGLIYRGNLGPLHLQASVRNDNISGYGNKSTGSLAIDFDLTPQWQIGIAGSTGFKAPTFMELYSPRTQWGSGNPDLRPEQSRNIEAKLQYQTDTTLISLTAYQNKIKDLINYPDIGPSQPYNVDSATIRGITLTAAQQYGNTTIRASADFMNPRNDLTGEQLLRRARQVYNLGVEHQIGAWNLGAEYQFTGKRYDYIAGQVGLVGGHSLLNLTAAYDFTDSVGVQVRWNNVLDKTYSNAYGYNTPGSNVFVNLSWRM